MKLTIGETEYSLRLLCGKFRELKDVLKSENLMQTISEAMQNTDVEVMAKALRIFCLDPKIISDSAACAIIDRYLAEEEHTVMDFGNVLLGVLDDSGFLPKRGMSQALREQMDKAMDQAMDRIGETGLWQEPENPAALETPEFQGFKA